MENCSSLSVAIWINLIYTDFVDIFDYISYMVAVILMILVLLIWGYWFIYPIIYYSEILIYPEIHERHWLLFLEFNRENIKNMFFLWLFYSTSIHLCFIDGLILQHAWSSMIFNLCTKSGVFKVYFQSIQELSPKLPSHLQLNNSVCIKRVLNAVFESKQSRQT